MIKLIISIFYFCYYVYIIQNGYSTKSLTDNSKNDQYLTRIAVWWHQDRSSGVSGSESGVLTANQKSY